MNRLLQYRIILITLFFLILLITLYFGLRFKGFRLENHVTWLQDEPGIHIRRFGIAYAKIHNFQKFSSLKKFTIEIAIKPEKSRTYGFDLIMSVHDENDKDQLIIGQWNSHVVIMNGDDYSHKRKIKRITAEIFDKPFKKLMLTLISGNKGTELYINGKPVKERPDLTLSIPPGSNPILTLGDSVYGNNSWNGDMYGFAFYSHPLPVDAIENHYKIWEETKSFSRFGEENPLILFDFDKKESPDSMTGISRLDIPVYFPVLKKRMLEPPWKGIRLDKSSIKDMVINLFGFMPMGAILYALLSNLCEISKKRIVLFSLLACFLLSLFIEITQAWIPSRSSQSLDLILNTAGGFLGAYGANRLLKRAGRIAHVG